MEQKTILIAEDEKDISEMYKIAFEQAGFRVLTAPTGTETIRIGKIEKPDMVLLDLNMPEKDGFAVLKEISEDLNLFRIFQKTPILILSNYSNEQDINYCLKMGAQEYIIKSDWTPERIVEKVRGYFEE